MKNYRLNKGRSIGTTTPKEVVRAKTASMNGVRRNVQGNRNKKPQTRPVSMNHTRGYFKRETYLTNVRRSERIVKHTKFKRRNSEFT